MQPDKIQNTLAKKILFSLLLAITFGVISTGTVLILKRFVPVPITVAPIVMKKTVSDVIVAYTKPQPIASLSSELYSYSENTATEATVNYKADNHSYGVSAQASHSLLFTSKADQPDDASTVQTQTTTLLKQLGLSKVENAPSTTTQNRQYTTYTGPVTICQLTNSAVIVVPPLMRVHELACADMTAIDKEYTTIETLLALYRKTGTVSDFSQATRYIKVEANKSYTRLTLTDGNKRIHSLLFASIDSNQEFLGDFAAADETQSNGKYSMTPAMFQAINNPKYGDFLTKDFIQHT